MSGKGLFGRLFGGKAETVETQAEAGRWRCRRSKAEDDAVADDPRPAEILPRRRNRGCRG